MNMQTGALLWSWDSGKNTNLTTPVMHNGYLFLGSVEGSIYKIDSQKGTLLWEFATEQSLTGFTAPITIVDNQLIVIGNDRILYSFSLVENAQKDFVKTPQRKTHSMFSAELVE